MTPSAHRAGVLAAGTWIADVSKRIDRWPEPTTVALIDQVLTTNGGGAFNVACDLARLLPGLPIRGMGLIGNDAAGDFIVNTCNTLGIDPSGLSRSDAAPTSFTDVMSERDGGRRTFFHLPGTNALFDESHARLEGATERVFYLGYLGFFRALDQPGPDGRTGAARLLETASRLGMTTAADLVSAPNPRLHEQVAPCLPHLDLLFANEWESARLLGTPLPAGHAVSRAEATRMARGLLDLGVRSTAILHFKEGAVCACRDGRTHALGAARVPPRDIAGTTGAGDAFAAGFILGAHEQMPPADCLELATAAAATCLHHIACSDSIRPWRDCLAYARSVGFAELL